MAPFSMESTDVIVEEETLTEVLEEIGPELLLAIGRRQGAP